MGVGVRPGNEASSSSSSSPSSPSPPFRWCRRRRRCGVVENANQAANLAAGVFQAAVESVGKPAIGHVGVGEESRPSTGPYRRDSRLVQRIHGSGKSTANLQRETGLPLETPTRRGREVAARRWHRSPAILLVPIRSVIREHVVALGPAEILGVNSLPNTRSNPQERQVHTVGDGDSASSTALAP